MSPLNKTGFRIAGAGAAAAALTLAAAAPVFAQTDYEFLDVWFNDSTTNERFAELNSGGQEAYLAIEGPDASAGDHVEMWIDFSSVPGAVDVAVVYDDRCEFADDVLTCVDDGTSDIAGSFVHLLVSLGEAGAPGDTVPYTVSALVNNEDEISVEGEIAVSDDYVEGGLPGDPEDPDPGEEPVDRFAYLDHTLTGATTGATLNAAPQILATEDAEDFRVGSLVVFTDAVDIAMWSDPGTVWDGYEMDADTATVRDEYDNCDKWEIWLVCAVTDWTPRAGDVYQPSGDTPIRYDIEAESNEDQIGVYSVSDLSEAGLEYYLEEFAIDLEGANQFTMSEVAADDQADADEFEAGEGWIAFSADTAPSEDPQGEDDKLDQTGSSQTIMISSAAAALLAGAAIFFVMRRRKAATTWE